MLGFCLKSSRYIVVDFDGRFRMVRTIKRANADDRWKVVSPRDPFSAADLESTPAEVSFSRGARVKSILLRNEWRGIRLVLSRQIQIFIQFRGCCTSSRVTSWRTDVRSLYGLQSIIQWWPCKEYISHTGKFWVIWLRRKRQQQHEQ